MALSFLNLGAGTNAITDGTGTNLYGSPTYPNPADFTVSNKTETKGGKTTYSYTVSERSAGAFTAFALGNFLNTANKDYFQGDLVENSNVTLKGNISAAGIGLGYGEDKLKVEGSASLALISTDSDPTNLYNWFTQIGPGAGSTPLAPQTTQMAFGSMLGNLNWFLTSTPLLPEESGSGYADSVEIKTDLNLSLVNSGLGSDDVKIGGGINGAILLLDGFSGVGGKGGNGKDSLEVGGNSNLALISAGANDDTVTFKSGAAFVNVNGGANNDKLNFNQGLLGSLANQIPTNLMWAAQNQQLPSVQAVGLQALSAPLGLVLGGGDNDTITFGGKSSSYGIAIFGDDPTDTSLAGDDKIIFGKGTADTPTWLQKSIIDLGGGSDSVSFGDFTNLKDVIIDCGGKGGKVDTITFSTSPTASFSAKNVLVTDFGLEDKIVYGGTTYTGAAALAYFNNPLNAGLGINIIPAVPPV